MRALSGCQAALRRKIGSWGLAASKKERNTTHLPVPPHPPAATGKKKVRKTAGGGGVLGKLGLKKGAAEGAEEEPAGAGTAGSPRYIQVRWCRGGLRQHACVDTEHGNRAERAMTETCNLHHSSSCPCQAASPPPLLPSNQVPHPTAGGPAGYPGGGDAAGPAPGTIIPGRISSHGPAYAGGGTSVTTTVVGAVPVSNQAVPVI